MRAMILAAGRGERMRELTSQTPKPLLKIQGDALIERMIHRLASAGVREIIINLYYLGEQIEAYLGDGSRFGVTLHYSYETERLETGGGIFKALPFFHDQPFLVVSADIVTQYPFQKLLTLQPEMAHLVMVSNPAFHEAGDFGLESGYIHFPSQHTLTYANIGVFHPRLFSSCHPGFFKLSQVLFPAIQSGKVTGEHYQGEWFNVGTPEELQQLNTVFE